MQVLDQLQKAKASVNRQQNFRKLGSCDIQLVISVDDQHHLVEFDAFSVRKLRPLTSKSDLRDLGTRIQMTRKQWNYYLRRRIAGKIPPLVGFSLGQNILHFATPNDRIHFLRVHQSIQAFIDTWAKYANQ